MNKNKARILFLSYVYPPKTIGGIQTYMRDLTTHVAAQNPDTYTLINPGGYAFLALFIPYSIFKAMRLIRRHGITHLHVASGPHCFQALLLKKLTGVKATITIHGLDIMIETLWLDRLIAATTRRLDRVFCVSNATKRECVRRGVPEAKCAVIFNGVDPDIFPLHRPRTELRKELSGRLDIPLARRKLLLSNGRLVKRKGVEWFIRSVLPLLGKDALFLVSGDGPERDAVARAAAESGHSEKLLLLGRTSDELLRLLYNTADYFIMPNIAEPGDMEGFGLVILEAASCGTGVIASDIEGISDAVVHGITGWLVPERNADAFARHIAKRPLPPEKVAGEVRKRYDWRVIASQYIEGMLDA
ncbi:MAG TPA: glycosyltransferase family 4 protein [Spirochaetota bacterium]|nr:glycosyltransferase family 4 protein [Spirochaetota bacterium]OPZ39201.1 MAG: GDP-mannose-dependent alpha-(1-6)-phosphatidylinositol monomannoside mannosyltransferase [Spirochaetes bacterium ADurb.BinA120]HNU92248.1 glycosyltransferase family 4 protein [Spirochaetota bacterium]HPI13858.1 glycosyltransferase family 4 protein [Spirochaetota bacterium]HPV96994.1 glycosyltransferase family 4 protein [Spirochaetota bacterium]